MKKFAILTFCMVIGGLLTGQIVFVNDTFNFGDGLPPYITIETSQTSNKWCVGAPQKVYLNSAHSAGKALITDSVNPFPPGDTSSFVIRFDFGGLPMRWARVWFDTKYDFDSLMAGGYFEIRYYLYSAGPNPPGWTDWVNMAYDSLGLISAYQYFKDYDTIIGGTPALTGRSDGWETIKFTWLWNLYHKGSTMIAPILAEFRFTAVSHPNALPTEGWMIDNLYLYCNEAIGNIEERDPRVFISAPFPNPGTGGIVFKIELEILEQISLEIFNQNGGLVDQLQFTDGEQIMVQSQHYPAGVYFYRLTTESGKVSQGRFIKL